jgi:fructokinase
MLFQLRTYGLKEISSLTFADWRQAVANANRAGARTCEFLGAMEAFRQLSNAIFN